jgi:hypothetical protein
VLRVELVSRVLSYKVMKELTDKRGGPVFVLHIGSSDCTTGSMAWDIRFGAALEAGPRSVLPAKPGREAVRVLEFLQGRPLENGSWRFEVGRERHGGFGGAFGGLIAACTVSVARSTAQGRVPISLDTRFLRGLPAGKAQLVPTILHAGRSLVCVTVDVFDSRERLATRSTVYLVDPLALRAVDHPGEAGSPPGARPWAEGSPWRNPPGSEVPILATFQPRAVGRADRGRGTALRVPWDEPGAAAEAACLAADMCVGPPVAGAFRGQLKPAPNPDLSLRFASQALGPEVVGWGLLESIDGGVATVRIEVRSGHELLAVGVSCSLLLASR